MTTHRDIRSLCNEIEAFLLFGPLETSTPEERLESSSHEDSASIDKDMILQSIHELEDKFQYFHMNQDEIDEKLTVLQEKINSTKALLTANSDFMTKYEKYVSLKYQIQLFTLAKLITHLDVCQNILEIPVLILNIKLQCVDNYQHQFHERSKIKAFVLTVITRKKKSLLDKFYKYFEEQFQEENNNLVGDSTTSSSSSSSSSSPSSSWELFLQRSRDWLLSYTLVSLLPSVLFVAGPTMAAGTTTSSSSIVSKAILEQFQESLDVALTPLWGRFYYHLQISLESRSQKQILWTFYYAKTFIEMLMNLILQITTGKSDVLVQLFPHLNYISAARQQIVEKSMKFLRAHIASIFVLDVLPSLQQNTPNNNTAPSVQSPVTTTPPPTPTDGEETGRLLLDNKFAMQIVEEVFELDHWLLSFQFSSSSSHHANSVPNEHLVITSGITEVVYDSREVFHAWMLSERTLLLNKLSVSCLQEEIAFSLFPPANSSSASTSIEVSSNGNSKQTAATTDLHCYQSIYDCISLFILLKQRYALFPLQAQLILSELLLEPLLCFILGLLLYHIRNHKLLYSISVNSFINKYPYNQNMEELHAFINTVNYFESCFIVTGEEGSVPTHPHGQPNQPQRMMVGNSHRCRKKWTIVQNWMPKIRITEEQQRSGFNLANLMKITFKIPEKFKIQGKGFEYRKLAQQQKHKIDEPDDDIQMSVNMMIELAKTLVTVLQSHFSE